MFWAKKFLEEILTYISENNFSDLHLNLRKKIGWYYKGKCFWDHKSHVNRGRLRIFSERKRNRLFL